MATKRLHIKADTTDPTWKLYANVIQDINELRNDWLRLTPDMPEDKRRQAIASALLAQAAQYHRDIWGTPRDQFVIMAGEEWDLHDYDNPESAQRTQ